MNGRVNWLNPLELFRTKIKIKEIMPTIRNESDRAKLVTRIGKLTGTETPLWGRMTVDQMMSHLVQAGDLPFEASLADNSSFAYRTFVKPLILYVLPMPKEVMVSADFDQQQNGRRPINFEQDRELLIASINRLAELPFDRECSYHPMFGKFTAKEWALIAHKHIDHHLKQFGV